MPQVVNAHAVESQFLPDTVPEGIEIAERLSGCFSGEEPGAAGHAGEGSEHGYRGRGERNVARPAGL